jgi:hypothetical protein
MSGIKDQEQLEALRRRLYDRGRKPTPTDRHHLSGVKIDVARGWTTPPATHPLDDRTDNLPPHLAAAKGETKTNGAPPWRRYRTALLVGSFAFFSLAVGFSSLYIYFGGNEISSRNISFVLSGPLAVSGGDVMPLQIAINNQNPVPLESVTLIMSYPTGTRSAENPPRDLTQERIPLNSIAAGETRTLPLRITVFGEENEQKEIIATIEYRLEGSSGTFYKEAEPFRFSIKSSPLIIGIDAPERVAAGQEMEVRLTLKSNAPTPLRNVLVSASYPDNFTFIRSTPAPSHRQSEWLIENIAPGASTPIVIRGVVGGLAAADFRLRFTAGTPSQDNQFAIGSVLSRADADFTVERTFITATVDVGGAGGDAVLAEGGFAAVRVTVINTHTEPIYDMVVRVSPSGNAFREENLQITDGHYNSLEKYLSWESVGRASLAVVLPGAREEFSFGLAAAPPQPTASAEFNVSVYSRRMSEGRLIKELIGVAKATVRYASEISLSRAARHVDGPHPPVADSETIYELTLRAEAGVNDLSGAAVTTGFPQYMRWIDEGGGDGQVEFNPVSKQLRWDIGHLSGGESRTRTIRVGLTPSVLQVNATPVIMGGQEFRASDRFAGVALRSSAPPVTTELSEEAGYERGNGRVRPRGG